MQSWECRFEEIQFKPLSETGESRGRMDLIRQIIPNHGSIKSKAEAKVSFIYVQMDRIEELPQTFYLDCCIFISLP